MLSPPRPKRFVRKIAARLGGARPKSLFEDDSGQLWLFKPQPLEQTMVDVIAASIGQTAGVPTPVVYAVDFIWNARQHRGSIQPYLGSLIQRPQLSRSLLDLSDQQRQWLQRHHVVDWLLANPDPHRGQFLTLQDGSLVGIDKSQALRFFPHDTLGWNVSAWPVNTRVPVYQYLFDGAQRRRFTLLPETAIDFARNVTGTLAGSRLRQLWQPYIATWPRYRLVYATLDPTLPPARAIPAVLDKIDQRRDHLAPDFEKLYFDHSGGLWIRP